MKLIREKRLRLFGRVYTISKKHMTCICIVFLAACIAFGFSIINKEKNNRKSSIIKLEETAALCTPAPEVHTGACTGTPSKETASVIQQSGIVQSGITETDVIYVHVAGAVRQPGLILIAKDSRVADAIEAAGGLSENADISDINLALRISDGTKIYIPVLGETAAVITPAPSTETEINAGENKNPHGLININTADVSELMQLSGIGEATAENIVKYRAEHGGFSSIEDIMSVSGIGNAKYNAIKDSICV